MGTQFEAIRELSGAVALMGLLAVAYGMVLRRLGPTRLARGVLGAVFGGAALLSMMDPVPVADGLFVDLRTLPVALAGAFLGLPGLAVALVIALAGRLGLGGAGVVSGSFAMLLAGGAGLAWDRWTRRPARRSPLALAGLALLTSVWVACVVAAPPVTVPELTKVLLSAVLPLHLLGVLVVGLLVERERADHAAYRGLVREAERDALTGLLNRRGFERAMGRLREGTAGALLLLDLDHFKRVNDRHGHPAGDAVLRGAAARILDTLGPRDLAARIGGEEIAVFLPGRDPRAARETALHLWEAIRSAPFPLPQGGTAPVTVSIGGAWGGPAAPEVLMPRADAALYSAKGEGRDCIRFVAEGPARSGHRGVPAALRTSCPNCPTTSHCPCRHAAAAAVEPPLLQASA